MGSSGRGYIEPMTPTLKQKIERSMEEEKSRLKAEVNHLLSHLVAAFNSRDPQETNAKLDKISSVLGEEIEIDRILFGGSIAKHTEVDGLSDVDALVILDKSDLKGQSAQTLLNEFYDILTTNMPQGDIQSIRKGKLAVTVTFDDKTEVQLLPALKSRSAISIAAADGKGWNDTKPREFQRELARQNKRMGNLLVPTIKLMKSINSDLPEQKRLTGYHIEALAVDWAKKATPKSSTRDVLLDLISHAAERVITPLRDPTGQSRYVDKYLGPKQSIERQIISQTLAGLSRRLDSTTNLSQWKSIFEKDLT